MYTLKIVAHDESIRLPPESLNHLRSTRIPKNPPELLICSYVRGLLSTFADTLRHGAPSALKQLSLDDDPLLLRSLAEYFLVGVSIRAVVIIDVNRGLFEQLSRGEYSTYIFPSASVDPVAVRAVQCPAQRNTIERSDVSLTTTPVGLTRVRRENDCSGGLGRAQHQSATLARDRLRTDRQS